MEQQQDKIYEEDSKILALLSHYLNHAPDFISREDIEEIVRYGVTPEYAFSVTFAAALGLDITDNPADAELYANYFQQMLHMLDVNKYYSNPYYTNIKIPEIKAGSSELKYESYKPYEAFVCNDMITTPEGRHIPQIGFFETEFRFPAVLENGRIWMTITPNEVETMKEAVAKASGKVLVYGLGLGYYAYMVSEKAEVAEVTIVESNEDVIQLFSKHIMPQFAHGHKITVIKADAFEYAQERMPAGNYDFVFTDLWHDVSDGIGMYLRMKAYEEQNPSTQFMYWIEQSLLCYL
ncbi:hypothetical protein C2I18_19525 [Paenibacillus sp. PK3_47]|uniref:spermine/spermidine synthase domain-containing protein n=1 Tax=Paenibacillus sp. PK3_47 TaxID=2072642 RepID=UPI00201E0CC9|nr:hypothetical protein [Paenibacillus sp. PK3_47]UQZ35519.1 hypothetical protein C2I18_19525 [Paenibacillus sp. PK3_47]